MRLLLVDLASESSGERGGPPWNPKKTASSQPGKALGRGEEGRALIVSCVISVMPAEQMGDFPYCVTKGVCLGATLIPLGVMFEPTAQPGASRTDCFLSVRGAPGVMGSWRGTVGVSDRASQILFCEVQFIVLPSGSCAVTHAPLLGMERRRVEVRPLGGLLPCQEP